MALNHIEYISTQGKEQGLVSCNRYGRYLFPKVVLDQLHALLAKAGLPKMRFHDLRHTMATILLESDVHPKKVQERLGSG